jgi:hypothetical protein
MNNTEGFEPRLGKPSLVWTTLAGLVGCVAYCAVPVVAATGVGGAALTALAHWLRPGMELVVGGASAVLTFALLALRASPRRPGKPACGGACECAGHGNEGEVFASGAPDAREPIACTADLRDHGAVQAQVDRYRAAFEHLVATEPVTGGFAWIFQDGPTLVPLLKDLAENEHRCCRFFEFTLRVGDGRVHWQVTADERAASVLKEFARLPERLAHEPRRGHDIAEVKRQSAAAGLAFTADEQ